MEQGERAPKFYRKSLFFIRNIVIVAAHVQVLGCVLRKTKRNTLTRRTSCSDDDPRLCFHVFSIFFSCQLMRAKLQWRQWRWCTRHWSHCHKCLNFVIDILSAVQVSHQRCHGCVCSRYGCERKRQLLWPKINEFHRFVCFLYEAKNCRAVQCVPSASAKRNFSSNYFESQISSGSQPLMNEAVIASFFYCFFFFWTSKEHWMDE